MLKRLGDMTIDEIVRYCNEHDECWKCIHKKLCTGTTINISKLAPWEEIAEIQVETK